MIVSKQLLFQYYRSQQTFFQLNRIPDNVRSCVVYSYQYLGSTCRSFKARRLEHLGLSVHTGNPILRPEFSNIRNHSEKI